MGQYDILDVLATNKQKWFRREEIEEELKDLTNNVSITLYKLRKSGFFISFKRTPKCDRAKGFWLYRHKEE